MRFRNLCAPGNLLVSSAYRGKGSRASDESANLKEKTRNLRSRAPATATGAPIVPDLRSEADVVQRARDGDRHALAKLVEHYAPGLFRFHARLLQDEELAADATQEFFLRVQRHFDIFDSTRSFRAWLYGIAWNVARDHLRREVRWRRTEGRRFDPNPNRETSPRTVQEPSDVRSRTPPEELESKERSKWVQDALEVLAPHQRALLLLREFEGLSYSELAELLGCELGTVKSRLNRARQGPTQALVSRRLDPELDGHRQGPHS